MPATSVSKAEFQAFVDRFDEFVANSDDRFNKFVSKYEFDMHGDGKPDTKEIGVIGWIRVLIADREEHPNLLTMLIHKPIQTVGTIVGIDYILYSLYTYFPGVVDAIKKWVKQI